MHAVLTRLALVPRGLMTLAVVTAAAAALLTVCGLVMWMLMRPRHRRAPTRA